MKRYRHLFFDLDHTLWDFRTNSREVLAAMHHEHGLAERGVPSAAELIVAYEEINEGLWDRYAKGHLPKEVMRVLRFRNTLLAFGLKDEHLAVRMGDDYLDRTPRKTALFPGAIELIRELRPHYGLHIITNGFEATQATKLTASELRPYFDHVVCSETAGCAKPDVRIFQRALKLARATAEESLMIGDNADADISGARNAGMDQAHFAPEASGDPSATYRIHQLDELRFLLR